MLTLFDLNSVPDIYINQQRTEIITFNESCRFSANNHLCFLLILSGSATLSISYDNKFFKNIKLVANSLLCIEKDYTYTINPIAKQCRLIYFEFDIYAISPLDGISATKEFDIKLTPFLFKTGHNPILISYYTKHFPTLPNDILTLESLLMQKNHSKDILRRQIEHIFLMIIKIHFSMIHNVINSFSAVALSNVFDITNQPFELNVSDIHIWSDNPKTNPEATLLLTAQAIHKYIEIPKNSNDYIYRYTKGNSKISDNYCTLTTTAGNGFKLWLFPGGAHLLKILEKYKEKAVIILQIKCSQPCIMQLFLYQIPTYQSVTYPVNISVADSWTSFSIPITGSCASETPSSFAAKAINYIQNNYASRLTVADIAEYVHIHPSYLSYVFKKSTGQSVNGFISFYRIEIAKQLLRDTEDSITSIAIKTGVYDSQHFLKIFKKIAGVTPSAYRKEHTNS